MTKHDRIMRNDIYREHALQVNMGRKQALELPTNLDCLKSNQIKST